MNNRYDKGIAELKAVKMTPSEKTSVLHNIMAEGASADRSQQASARRVPTPFLIPGLQLWIDRHRLIGTVIAAILIVVIAGSGVAFASERALPGDVLYPIKVAVTEPIRGALQTTPAAQASWQTHLASERLSEAEALAMEGKLDTPKKQEIESLLAKHAAAFESAISKTERTYQNMSTKNPIGTTSQVVAREPGRPESPKVSVMAIRSPSISTTTATTSTYGRQESPRSEALKTDFQENLRSHANTLEKISRNDQSSTTQTEIRGVIDAALKHADAVDHGQRDNGDRGQSNRPDRSNRFGDRQR